MDESRMRIPPPATRPDTIGARRLRLSDQVADRVLALIDARQLRPGDRLPAERALALELGVSRTVLREAIARLASQGVLYARQGGGTYLCTHGADASPRIAPLQPFLGVFRSDPEYRYDVLEIRHGLEGMASWHAALRATDDDRARIADAFDAMAALHGRHDPAGEARADAAFHLSIAEASHNLVLLQVMRGMFELLQTNISQSRETLYVSARTFEPLLLQHRAMRDAVLSGDPEGARAAAHTHLAFVHTSLRELDENEARRARASRLPPSHA